MLGAVLGRINFKAWLLFVPLWTTCIYTVNAFLIWGGGFWAQKGAVDYSGGYVIHLAAGVSGFVAAAVIGPRLARDREIDAPNNLLMVACRRRSALARLERLQRRRPVLRGRGRRGRRAEHEPRHRGRVPRLGRLGLRDRPQAVADRQRQRHDRRPRRDHARRRLRQRLRRDGDRRDRRERRLRRLQLPQPRVAVPHRRRHARRHLHARHRRSRRRPARRPPRRLEHDRLPRPRQHAELRGGGRPTSLEDASSTPACG